MLANTPPFGTPSRGCKNLYY